MNIRPITKADIPVVRALTAEIAAHERFEEFSVPESYFEENFLGDNPYTDVYMIDFEGNTVGMGHVTKRASTYTGGHELFLTDFIITQSYRGKGLGKQFIKFLCQLAQERQCQKISWGVYSWNKEALGLYEKVSEIETEVYSCHIDKAKIQEILKN